MTNRIAILGPTRPTADIDQLAENVGNHIEYGLATGACPGVPELIAAIQMRNGGQVTGYSPFKDLEAHRKAFRLDPSASEMVYVGTSQSMKDSQFISDILHRNVSLVTGANAGIYFLAPDSEGKLSIGTFNEATIGLNGGLPVIVASTSEGLGQVERMLNQLAYRTKPSNVHLLDNAPEIARVAGNYLIE